MSTTIKTCCIALFLPFLAALAHDVHFNYFADARKKAQLEALDIDPAAFQISDLGYLLYTYERQSYENLRSWAGETSWNQWVEPLLQTPTMLAALIPLTLFAAYLVLAKLLGLPPFNTPRLPKGVKSDVLMDRDEERSFKYKRK